MTEQIKAKREELKAISAPFKILLKEGAIGSINEGLANYCAEQGHKILNSYNKWKEQGFQVKKNSKALLMWGEPQQLKKKTEDIVSNTDNKEEEESFFPLAYVFSNLQVEPIETKEMRK